MQKPGRNSQETIVQLWDKVLVPTQRIHKTIYLSCSAGTDTPAKWRKLAVCCPPASRPKMGWNQRLLMLINSPPTSQKNVHTLITPSSNHYYKTPHYPPGWDI